MELKLEERALLVKLSIGSWSASKTDKTVSAEVAVRHSANGDAGRYSKYLISRDALKGINKVMNAARVSHYELTLPWTDDGARIITTESYQNYTKVMREYRMNLQNKVDEFVVDYEGHINDARKSLGSMFNKDDYPAPSEVKAKFWFDVEPTPIPVSTDFRAKVSNAEAKAIAKDIERRTQDRLDAAMKDVWDRIATVTQKMAEKLDEYVPKVGLHEAEGVFRDSLVGNIKDLTDILPSLNINNDPVLTKIHKDMVDHLCSHDANELRENDVVRKKTAKKAKQIFDKVSQYLA